MFRCLMAIAMGVGICRGSSAAEITVTPLSNSAVVVVTGEITEDDDIRFNQRVAGMAGVVVSLASPGGKLVPGLNIGITIRKQHFSTIVPDHAICASTCGLIWLAGSTRYMGDGAYVGFHAASQVSDGSVDGMGNALIGAYISKLGLSYNAVMYLTHAKPEEMAWLTMEQAQRLGIAVSSREPAVAPAPNSPETAPLAPVRPKPNPSVRLAAPLTRIESLDGMIEPQNVGDLSGLACRNYDRVVRVNITIDWPSEDQSSYNSLAFWTDHTEYLFPKGSYYYRPGSGWVIDGYFIVRSKGTDRGVVSFEKLGDTSVLPNRNVVTVRDSRCALSN